MFTKKKESEELETRKMRISYCFQIQIFEKKNKIEVFVSEFGSSDIFLK